ncbi:MAG: hypothetical protein ACFBRM_12815 [Pikeienuella sp.]
MRLLILAASGLLLAACAAPGTPGAPNTAVRDDRQATPLVLSPSGRQFTRGPGGRQWPPRGRPNK